MKTEHNVYFALIISIAILAGLYFLTGGLNKKPATAPQGKKISIEDWYNALKARVPTELCRSPSYLEECFKLEPEICALELDAQFRICFDDRRDSMPNSLRGPKDAAYWGNSLINCSVESVQNLNQQKRAKAEYCRSLNSWVNERPNGRLTKAQFLFSLEWELPGKLCQARSNFLRRCFELTDQQCYDESSQAVNKCLERIESAIQGDVRVPVDTLPITNTITNCAIKIITSKFSSQKRSDCDDNDLFEEAKTPN